MLIIQRIYMDEVRKITMENPFATSKEIKSLAEANLNLDIDETGNSRSYEYAFKMGITNRAATNAIYYARQLSRLRDTTREMEDVKCEK